jgi:hypothetical protein
MIKILELLKKLTEQREDLLPLLYFSDETVDRKLRKKAKEDLKKISKKILEGVEIIKNKVAND